ncbi:hypothetical protein JNUCC0626_24960 [Lentzea sp. JNUCC 0626]|uniref:hypothetical protein n=1 Tax=Lentzea sp. JNUCC 0626 TaxID=3367513 RepID=UPI0037496AE2
MTLPFRYEVFRDVHGHDEEVLVRAVDAEGLFADTVVPPRELLVFRGCPPDIAESFHEVFGFEVADDDGMYQWWALGDVTVHAVTPDGDVFATASPCFFPWGSGKSSGETRYLLRRGNSQDRRCASIDGFPRTDGSPDRWPPVRLIGCEIAQPVRDVLERPHLWHEHSEELRALDVNGREMAVVPFGVEILDAEPSSLGDGLLDITFSQSHVLDARSFPKAGGRPAWERWRAGVPTQPNQWAGLSTQARSAWLELLVSSDDRPDGWSGGGVFHLDGRHATDSPGLFLALNEGLLGPGAYFGKWRHDVEDHLHLPCCGPPPGDITVVWHHADVARYAVPEEFEWAVKTLGYSVNLVLD